MQNNTFAHLHNHTEYSQLDGYGKTKQYISYAKELGFEYLGITDHGCIDGCIDFQKECDKQEIHPVLGSELYIVPHMEVCHKSEKRGHITLLVKNEKGWASLCKMITKANLDGFYKRPRVDYPTMLDADLSGLIIMTGCSGSFLSFHKEVGEKFLSDLYDKKNGKDLYFEIMPHNIQMQKVYNKQCKELSKKLKLPFVATNDCHYIKRGDWKVQEVLLAIQRQATWNDPNRWSFGFRGLHLRTAQEMLKAFEKDGTFSKKEIFMAMRNTIKIAEECCNYRIPKRDISLPKMGENEVQENTTLHELCDDNLKQIISLRGDASKEYIDRFNYEMNIIKKKKFARYFLIVHEIIDWCKKNDIMTGPRGSVCGSLVAHLAGITTIDPIKHGLIFSRFISEDRIDYPDIDIDFEDIKKPLIREHLEELYGKNNICGISTFTSLKGRGAARDVARVFEVPYQEADQFAKTINLFDYEKGNSIQKAIDNTEEGKNFERKYPEVVELAIKLEGQIRGGGQHPAAVVISKEDLTQSDRVALCRRSNVIVSNWNMEDSEHVGLMKLDILGLGTLTILQEFKRLIKKSKSIDINFNEIQEGDPAIFEEISKGHTEGMFQISTIPSTELCMEMGIENFFNIACAVALVRPGPTDSGMTEEFIKRKHGANWRKKHPMYEEVTKDTFGILVFQEQVMQVISRVAGMSETDADKIRKIIGKKRDAKEFAPYKKQFIAGCKKQNTLSESEANKFWDGLTEWAKYGFNLSHSVGYATVAYWTAWAKIYYPTEFICASLTYGEKKVEMIREAKRIGLQIIPPKIGKSDALRWMAEEKKLYAPFIEIKGIGEKQAKKICEKRINTGFFNLKNTPQASASTNKVLQAISAYDLDVVPDNLDEYFDFSFSKGTDSIPHISTITLIKNRFRNPALRECTNCDLVKECKGPVLPSVGQWNCTILAEAPGPDEDKEGKVLVGRAGQLLWKEISFYDYPRSFFHATNCCKCYPSETRTPKPSHIEACWPWLKEELQKIDCKVILALGNTPLYALTGKKSGITELSGKSEWVEKVNAWVCWCVHPSSVLRRGANKTYFEKGIKNFAMVLDEITLIPF